jgi:transposase
MSTVTTIGLDIAKSVLQVHGISATGEVLIRRQVRRGQVRRFFTSLPPCLIGIEACASAHHWSRELQSLGHEVKLMPPAYVKPYVKRQKNDRADALRPARFIHKIFNRRLSSSKYRSLQEPAVAHL